MDKSLSPRVLDQDVIECSAAELPGLLAHRPPWLRVIRVGNPLRTPLTLPRLLIQAGHYDEDASLETSLDGAFSAQRGESAVLLVIEQADTLDDGVRPALAAAVERQRRAQPPLHIAYVHSAPLAESPAEVAAPALAAPPPSTPEPPASLPSPSEPPVQPPGLLQQPEDLELPLAGDAPPTDLPAANPRRSAPPPGSMAAVAVQHRRPPAHRSKPSGRWAMWLVILIIALVVLAGIAYAVRSRLHL